DGVCPSRKSLPDDGRNIAGKALILVAHVVEDVAHVSGIDLKISPLNISALFRGVTVASLRHWKGALHRFELWIRSCMTRVHYTRMPLHSQTRPGHRNGLLGCSWCCDAALRQLIFPLVERVPCRV